jgi:hypothetical protein
MKTIRILLFGLIAMFYMPFIQAQTTPAITGIYSDKEIDQLVRAYAMADSRDATPSQSLQQTFVKNFPNAFDVEWETAANVYEVEFEIGHADYKAYYDKDGNLLMYYYEIKASKLPVAVRDAAKGRYPKYRFDEIKKIHKGTAVFYKIEMECRDSEFKIVVKSDGSFVDKWID